MTDGLWTRAQAVIPGGVNSPVRSFRSVGGEPFFVERGEGAYLFDTEGRRYVDYVLSWGPLILGHAHPVVTEALERQLGRNQKGIGMPVVATRELQQQRTTGRRPSEPERGHGRFGSTVDEPNHLHGRHQTDDALCQLHLCLRRSAV